MMPNMGGRFLEMQGEGFVILVSSTKSWDSRAGVRMATEMRIVSVRMDGIKSGQ